MKFINSVYIVPGNSSFLNIEYKGDFSFLNKIVK